MAKHYEVLAFLCPEGNYVQLGEDYEGITFLDGCEPFTKKEYLDAFAQFDSWKTQQESEKAEEKAALLNRLGITEDEAKLLLS